MNLFRVPAIQALRRHQRVRRGVAAFVCLSVLLSGIGITRADDSGPSSSNVEGSAPSKEVTYRGCLIYNGQRKAFVLVTRDDEAFDLTGNVSVSTAHAFYLPVSVRGIELSPPKSNLGDGNLLGKLEVRHLEVLRPVAELDKSIRDVSQWIRKTDEAYGVGLAAPRLASFERASSLVSRDLSGGTISDMNIGFPIYPKGGPDDGRVVIYVSTATSEKDTYRAGKKIERVNGLKYTECVEEGEIRFDVCSVYTFQNNLSYRFNFWFHIGQPGAVESGCLDPPISRSQEQSFIRLFLSQVTFLRPKVPAADARHAASKPPQIVSFEKTALMRRNAYSLRLALSWKARYADYVQLSYTCPPKVRIRTGQVDPVDIEDASFSRSCGNPWLPDVVANRPPESSQEFTLNDRFQREPVTIQITLTPFSHGDAFPQSSKSLSIEVPRP